MEAQNDVATKLTERAVGFAAELGARARTISRSGDSPADEIVAAALDAEVDLVVFGANLRQIEGRPFLGHVVEQVLEECDTTVVVVATRQDRTASGIATLSTPLQVP